MSVSNTLLCSPSLVKREAGLDDNFNEKILLAAIRDAQNIDYRGLIGDALYKKLISLVDAGTIGSTGNEAYNSLLEESQYFLAFASYMCAIARVNTKVGNMGVIKTTDASVASASAQEVENTKAYFQALTDRYRYLLQAYLIDNETSLPELTANKVYEIRCNLRSAATCGLWLGGIHGR